MAGDRAERTLHHCTPVSERNGRESAGTTVRSVLLTVTAQFGDPEVLSSRVYRPETYHPYPPGVLLFPLDGQRLHVVGADDLATEIRQVLRKGAIPGWSLHEITGATTPIGVLRSLVTARTFGVLEREPFTTIEEVATVPDRALLDLRHVGEKTIEEIRTAIASPEVTQYRQQRPSDAPPAGQVAMNRDDLPHALQLRLAPFLDLLANAGLPAAAESAIIASLATEPVPPADHVVSLLLETAGAHDALAYYLATHGPQTSTWP